MKTSILGTETSIYDDPEAGEGLAVWANWKVSEGII